MKQRNDQRVQTILLAAILVILLVATLFIVIGFRQIQGLLQSINWEALNETSKSLSDAADQLASLDMDTLNGFISNLQELSQQLTNVTNGIGHLFGH